MVMKTFDIVWNDSGIGALAEHMEKCFHKDVRVERCPAGVWVYTYDSDMDLTMHVDDITLGRSEIIWMWRGRENTHK